ncbi:hypothetical protein D3C85_1048020 [compost metagenome]
MLAVKHAVHADDFSRQVKAGDLDLAGRVFKLSLEAAEAHAIHGVQRVIQRIQRLAFFKADTLFHQLVQLFDFRGSHAHGNADVAQHACGTVGGIRGNGDPFLHTMTFRVPIARQRAGMGATRETGVYCSPLLLRVSYRPPGVVRARRWTIQSSPAMSMAAARSAGSMG